MIFICQFTEPGKSLSSSKHVCEMKWFLYIPFLYNFGMKPFC